MISKRAQRGGRYLGQAETQLFTGERPDRAADVAETALLVLTTSLGLVSWVAVLLAEFGWLEARAVALTLVLAIPIVWAGLKRTTGGSGVRDTCPRAAPNSRGGIRSASVGTTASFATVLVVAATVFLPPFESVLWAGDATVYLAFGRKVAETGALRFEDPLLADVPSAVRRELFLNPVPEDATGPYARFPGGLLIPDIAVPEVTAGFAPLFPAMLALAWTCCGHTGALHLTPLLGLLAVGSLFLLGYRLGGRSAAVLTGLLMAVSLPQIWFARLSMAEVVAQPFVFAGLLALLASRRAPRLAPVGGGLFGVAALAKFELAAILGLSVIGLAVLALISGCRTWRCRVSWFALPFFLLLLHYALHLLWFPSHYRLFVLWKLDVLRASWLPSAPLARTSGTVVGAVVVAGIVALAAVVWKSLRGNGSWPGTLLLSGTLVVCGSAYVVASTNRLSETLPWLGWYLSWPLVGIFVGSALLIAWRGFRASMGIFFVLWLVSVAGFHHLYDPQEATRHIWSVRRFVPIVLPGMLLVASVGVTTIVARVSRRLRPWLLVSTGTVLVGSVALPASSLHGGTPWQGSVEAVDRFAEMIAEDAVALFSSDLAGTHLATTLGYIRGRDALLLRSEYRDPTKLEDQVLDWLHVRRDVVLSVGEDPPHLSAPHLALEPIASSTVTVPLLESTRDRRPREIVEETRRVRVFRVLSAADRRSVDVGSLEEDLLFPMSGFHAPETDSTGATFRWTQGIASIDLHDPGLRIRLLVGGGRPPEVPPARITIRVAGRAVIEGMTLPNAPTRVLVEHGLPKRDSSTLTIESTVFNPQELGLSQDGRQLGVKVYRIDY